MIELTEYAKDILRENPDKVNQILARQAILKAISSSGLIVVSIREMNILMGTNI